MRIGRKECGSSLSKGFRAQRLSRLRLSLIGASTLIALAGLLFPQTAGAAPAAPELAITVRVYDYAQTSPSILDAAEREAGRIFGQAGLKLVWLDCMPEPATPPPDPCKGVIESEDVRLRILPTPVQNFLQDTVFGFAIAPALATVYYETALSFAKYDHSEFEAPVVLGCAIAHEIGHLLLGSNAHSFSGIMRARWERDKIQLALTGGLLFTPSQAKLMHAEMQRRLMSQLVNSKERP